MEPNLSAHVATPTISRRGGRRLWPMVGILLALMVVFEVGIRHIPPDGMTVTYAY